MYFADWKSMIDETGAQFTLGNRRREGEEEACSQTAPG